MNWNNENLQLFGQEQTSMKFELKYQFFVEANAFQKVCKIVTTSFNVLSIYVIGS